MVDRANCHMLHTTSQGAGELLPHRTIDMKFAPSMPQQALTLPSPAANLRREMLVTRWPMSGPNMELTPPRSLCALCRRLSNIRAESTECTAACVL